MKQNLYNNEDVFNYSKVDTSNEDSLLNELITEIPTDEMEKTLELDTLPLDNDEKVFLEPKPKIEAKKEKKKLLPWTTATDHHMEYAFVHCSILAFITAFMGTGMITYILMHI